MVLLYYEEGPAAVASQPLGTSVRILRQEDLCLTLLLTLRCKGPGGKHSIDAGLYHTRTAYLDAGRRDAITVHYRSMWLPGEEGRGRRQSRPSPDTSFSK